MALRKLLLRNKLDVKTKALKDLRDKDADFEKREKLINGLAIIIFRSDFNSHLAPVSSFTKSP